MTLPPWPGWDGLHPLIIHFPIALLIVAPVFVLLAIVVRGRASDFSRAALVLLVLGTLSTFVAVQTGEAAGELAEHTDAINAVISQHSSLAETTRNVFTVLTLLYATFVLLSGRLRILQRPAVARGVHVVLFVVLAVSTLLVASTAHLGGRLVHQLGVHAIMAPAAPSSVEAVEH